LNHFVERAARIYQKFLEDDRLRVETCCNDVQSSYSGCLVIYEYICRYLLDIVKLLDGYGQDKMLQTNFSLYINQDISFGTKIARRDRQSTGLSSIPSRSKRFVSARKYPDRP
jgi:hypothetical protein